MPIQNQQINQETPFDDCVNKSTSVVAPKVIVLAARGTGAKKVIRINPNFTPLLSAVFKFDLQLAASVLSTNPEFVNMPEPTYNCTPLLLACEIKNDELALEFARLLVSHGANVSHMNSKSKTSLYQACAMGNVETARFLIEECGDDVNQPFSHHRPLVAAIGHKQQEAFDYLISKGADIHMPYNTTAGSGYKPLHTACQMGVPAMVKKLIELGADLNDCSNTTQHTPFYCACIGGNLEVIKILLAKGAKVNAPIIGGVLPIHIASQCTNAAVVEYLLSNGVEYAPDAKGNYPLAYAKKEGKNDIIAFYNSKYTQKEEAGCCIM